jgi:TatD DNase family protein
VLKQLRQYKLFSGGIVHAFSGSEQQAKQYLALGFKLGLGGTVTYERAKKLRHIVTELPLDSFVLETDAPDMPLSGYQGEPNRPARVREVAQVIAELKGCSLQEVASATSLQASKLLDL